MQSRAIYLQSLWMIVAGLLFACMGVFVKLGSKHFSSAELVFYRSVIGLIVIYAIVRTKRLSLTTPHWRAHLWRGISGFVALMLYFYSISLLPLATAVTLNYSSPIFLAIFTLVILKEQAPQRMLVAIVLGFIGVILLLRPSLHAEQLLGGTLGLISGILAAIAYINVRHLGSLREPEWRVVFYFSLISTVGAACWALPQSFHAVSSDDVLILLGLGITATLAQLAMTRAYGKGRTLLVASLAYSTVVFASIFGLIIWNETLSPSSWFAILLIVSSGVLSAGIMPRGR